MYIIHIWGYRIVYYINYIYKLGAFVACLFSPIRTGLKPQTAGGHDCIFGGPKTSQDNTTPPTQPRLWMAWLGFKSCDDAFEGG